MSMNIRRMALAALAALMTAGGSVAAATTGSASHLQPAAAHVVKTLGGEIFKPNLSVTVTLRFAPGSLRVRSGDTVVFDHADMGRDPHTVSVVAAKDLPRHTEPCPACDRVEQAHFPHGQSQPPSVVNVGRPGLDQPGDSIVWMSGRASVKVSAPAGTVLHYFCALHPWMQGTITVVK
jgi:plastocyanin